MLSLANAFNQDDMKDFLKMAKTGKVYLFGDGKLKLNPIHGKDLANEVVNAIRQDKKEINKVAKIINQIAGEIPDGIDWILRVDGHTDRIPFSGFGKDYKDNWELSQARALSVVRYLMDDLKIPANRLAANGFGEFQPIDDRDTPEAYKTNRRIELKFTER